MTQYPAIVAQPEIQLIGQRDKLENRLQKMVPVPAPANDVQEEVQFCRSRPACACQIAVCQSWITSRT